MKKKVFIFGWPSHMGGADTKLAHLLPLLREDFEITVVPNEERHLKNIYWTQFLTGLGIKFCLIDQLPSHDSGVALSMSNQCFFTHRIAHRAKDCGLFVVWSSEMMWHHEGELEAVHDGIIDKVLYTSELQRSVLQPGYGILPGVITGNYIDADAFPFVERRNPTFTIGRLSRPAPEKYPEDFPVFYEALGLPEVRFRVMAWSRRLEKKYRWHDFGGRWELLKSEEVPTVDFLSSLDLFVYPLGHDFVESWGRSTVEAMLTGALPLVPSGHHLEHLVIHGETGFVCEDFLDFKEHAHELYFDTKRRRRMSQRCREYAVKHLCNREEHLKIWKDALS